RADGGLLPHAGTVEVVSSLERDGRPVSRDLRWGVYVTFEAPTDYVRDCFAQYGLKTDASGRYASMYKPYHLIGLELGYSVASIAVRGQPTGSTLGFNGDTVAVAKRDLQAGERLDGEGGYMVYGKLMPAAASLNHEALPIGLAHGIVLRRAVAAGQTLSWADVSIDDSREAIRVRRDMEALFRSEMGLLPPPSEQAA
ncbi:SAF domain-containing protein, partial [Herbaspirillum frisingense]